MTSSDSPAATEADAAQSESRKTIASRFLLIYAATIIGLAVGLCALVTATDPARYFFGSPFPPIAVNSRRDKIDLFRAYSDRAKVSGFILGSSRTGLLRPDMADQRTGLRFFNASVDSGTIDDDLAIYRLFSELQSAPPREVLLGVDTLLFSSQIPPDFGLLANYALSRHLDKDAGVLSHYALLYGHYFRFQTFPDFGVSLKAWRLRSRGELHARYEYDPNGRWRLAREDREILSGTYNYGNEIRASLQTFLNQYKEFNSVSELRMQRLESLLREASRDGAHVVLFFTPIHPELQAKVDGLEAVPAIEQRVKETITQVGLRYGASVIDLSLPESFGSDPSTWYDSVHASQADADRELELILHRAGK